MMHDEQVRCVNLGRKVVCGFWGFLFFSLFFSPDGEIGLARARSGRVVRGDRAAREGYSTWREST